jgi:sugar lactone lactonase YvrE
VTAPTELKREPWLSDLSFPEGLRWRADTLWFSDMVDGVVRTVRPGDARAAVVAEVRGRPSGLGFRRDGVLLVTSMRGRRVLRHTGPSTETEEFVDVRAGGWTTLNDMLVHPETGNAYVDAYRGEDNVDSAVLLVTPRGDVSVAAELPFPNGMALLPTTGELAVASSSTATVRTFAIRDDGTLEPTGSFAELPGRSPDGLTADAEGALWVSSYTTGEYLRVERGGRITHRIEFPGDWTVDCELGGADGTTLFLARTRTAPDGFQKAEADGWLDVATAPVPAA